MIVITMTNCPPKLRGDLTKWLLEINTGVYVGNVSARVREALWDRVCENINDGQATLVYNSANEQHMEFKTHNSAWKIRDFDGVKLIMRPNVQTQHTEELPAGFSNASKYLIAGRRKNKSSNKEDSWVFIDIETTGLDVEKDKIIELAVLEANTSEIISDWNTLVKIDGEVPPKISEITGITNETLEGGSDIAQALREFGSRIADKKVVCYNRRFDIEILDRAFKENQLEFPIGKVIDALTLARKRIDGIENYQLSTLAEFFEIPIKDRHRAASDCELLYRVFLKLNEI